MNAVSDKADETSSSVCAEHIISDTSTNNINRPPRQSTRNQPSTEGFATDSVDARSSATVPENAMVMVDAID